MNREIKFRAWDTKRNKMWSAEQLGSDQVGLLPDGRGFANISGESHDRTVLFEHLIPLQYTGATDIDNDEIYERDIVGIQMKSPNEMYKATVEFSDYQWYLKPVDEDKWIEDWNFIDDCNRFKILGNIYEEEEGK